MQSDDLKARRPVAEFVVVSIETAVLGIVALVGLAAGRGRGRCGDVCRMATPYLVVAAALCTACLLGLATTWVLGRSAIVQRPARIASWGWGSAFWRASSCCSSSSS